MSVTRDFLRILEVQRNDYTRVLPGKVAAIERLWNEVRSAAAGPDALATLVRMAHGLAGSGAMFGFDDLSIEAGRLERRLQELAARGNSQPWAESEAVAASLGSLRRCVARSAVRT